MRAARSCFLSQAWYEGIRYVVWKRELRKRVAQDGDALDGEARLQGVDGLKSGASQSRPLELSLGVGDTRVAVVAGRLEAA